jgi:hypothetical protein
MKFHCTIRQPKGPLKAGSQAAGDVMKLTIFANNISLLGDFHDGCANAERVMLSRLLGSVAGQFVETSVSFPAEFSRPWMPWALHWACEVC